PALFLSLGILCVPAHSASFAVAIEKLPWETWGSSHPVFLFAAAALGIVLLAENARIPFDDPNTHLELTMIHEVMVLDHGGPAFGMILYGAALKLFLFGALIVRLACPFTTGSVWLDWPVFIGGLLVGAGVGGRWGRCLG